MKNTNKKGFTIVELVIVIAVIAILAAVLIPTFASIIRKANIASDTQLAKNLNTALATAEAGEDKPENFADVLAVLRDNGYIVSNLNPTTEGWYYVWESDSNQILLVDSEDNYAIKYQSKELKAENEKPGKTWNFAVSQASMVDTIKALGSEGNNPYVVYTPKTTDDLMNAFGNAYQEGGVISVSSDIILSDDEALMGTDATGKEVSFDLGNNVLTSTGVFEKEIDGKSYTLGQLTVAAGTLNVSNGSIKSENAGKFVITAINNGEVNVSNVTLNSTSVGAVALRVLGDGAEMNVVGTKVNMSSTIAVGAEIGLGEATFENVDMTVNATTSAWNNVCLAASKGGTITVNSGTYTAEGTTHSVLGFYTSPGNYVINGGTFVSSGKISNPFDISSDYVEKYETDAHVIKLYGGVFKFDGNKTVDIAALTDSNYESEITSMFGNANHSGMSIEVTKIEGGYQVTIK